MSHRPGEWWATPTTNTDAPMPNFNNLVMYTNEDVLNIIRNILDDEEPKFHRQVICRPNADLWHSAMEAEIDALRRNHTWVVDARPSDRTIVDSKWVFKVKFLADGSIHKFKAQLVAKAFSPIRNRITMRRLHPWYVLIPCVFSCSSSLRRV
jgi:hypothetical protein